MRSISSEIIILTLFFLLTYSEVSSRKFERSDAAQCDDDYYKAMWTVTGEVPDKFPEVPPGCLYMSYNEQTIRPNYKVPTEEMLKEPVLDWNKEPGALYTIFMMDYGITRLEGLQYYHWIMSNVGDEPGDEVQKYIPPFGYKLNEDGTDLDDTEGTFLHDILALVYKQKSGKVNMVDEQQSGCDPTIEGSRIGDHVAIAEKYNMELVAGNFFFTTYSAATNEWLCYFTKCTGKPFPIPLPGINDLPECQAEGEAECQKPGTAICYLSDYDLPVGDPCCSGSECLPWIEEDGDKFCQFTSPIQEGGDCGNYVGKCDTGLSCVNDKCIKGSAVCQNPGDALCKVPGADLDLKPCCDGSECKAWTGTEKVDNWYCQFTKPIPEGGSCDKKEGDCEAGTTCTNGVCAVSCLDIGDVCYENLVYQGSCCDNVCFDCDATTKVCKCKKPPTNFLKLDH